MAIYHLTVKVIGRNSGRTSVGAAAYRAGDKLTNEYDGVTHDYTNKKGIEYTEIMLPDNAPREYYDRSTLWNAVEKIETMKDAQLAREVEVALPNELELDDQIDLLHRFINDNFTVEGMCVDFAIHNPKKKSNVDGVEGRAIDNQNYHAHILMTMRPMDEHGNWQKKVLKEYVCIRGNEEKNFTAEEFKKAKQEGWEKQYKFQDGNKKIWLTAEEGKRLGLARCDKQPKTTRLGRQNPIMKRWNDTETVVKWRKSWELEVNKILAEKGFDARIDCRSFKDQGRVDEIPTIHMGVAATSIDSKAQKNKDIGRNKVTQSYKAVLNEEIKKHNAMVKELNAKIDEITIQIQYLSAKAVDMFDDLQQELFKALRQRNELNEEIRLKQAELSKLKHSIEQLNTTINSVASANNISQKNITNLQKEKDSLGILDHKKKTTINQKIADEQGAIKARQQYLSKMLGQFNMTDIKDVYNMMKQFNDVDEEHKSMMDEAVGCVDGIQRLAQELVGCIAVISENRENIILDKKLLVEMNRNRDISFPKEMDVFKNKDDIEKQRKNKSK